MPPKTPKKPRKPKPVCRPFVADDDMSYEKQLKTNGFVVIPCISYEQAQEARADVYRERAKFPEYKSNATEFVGGSFAAYGNPSSFHNPTVRRLREWAQTAAVPELWKPYVRKYMKEAKLEQCFDRLMIRPTNKKVGDETWHRDEAVGLAPGDRVFGGWICLDDCDQFFHCVPGTHIGANNQGGGFAKIPKDDEKAHAEFRAACVAVAIPPGHMLVFFEHIVHEVVSKTVKHEIVRLFVGWRLTRADNPLHPNTEEGLRANLTSQSVMQIKSDQIPTIVPSAYWNYYPVLYETFSKNFIDKLIKPRAVASKTSKNYGKVYNVVDDKFTSLLQMDLPRYRPYKEKEIAMHLPRKRWTNLLLPGRKRAQGTVSL
jgi:hypothetical protein